jgi:hypothetical protein
MAGSQRIRRHRHATERDRGRESDEGFFVKHVILLCSNTNLFVTAPTTPDRRERLQDRGHVRVSDRDPSP